MSLYWILALTMTLLSCVAANPTRSIEGPKKLYGEIDKLITEMKNNGCQENNATFYIPSDSEKCTIKALDCSIQELEKVRTECFEGNIKIARHVYKTRDSIMSMLVKMNITLQTNPHNCFCNQEMPKEKPLPDFLNNILKLLQMLLSKKYPNEA